MRICTVLALYSTVADFKGEVYHIIGKVSYVYMLYTVLLESERDKGTKAENALGWIDF